MARTNARTRAKRATGPSFPAWTGLARHKDGGPSGQRSLREVGELVEAADAKAGTPAAHNFGRIRIYARSPVKLQTKTALGVPGDAYEREAEQVAERVMDPFVPQDHRGETTGAEKSNPGQGQEHGSINTYAAPVAVSPTVVNRVLDTAGRPLEPSARAFMEPRFGHDFAAVRVHADDLAAESARALGALAYTVGRQIVFDGGAYRPDTAAGRRLLAQKASPHIQRYARPDAATREL